MGQYRLKLFQKECFQLKRYDISFDEWLTIIVKEQDSTFSSQVCIIFLKILQSVFYYSWPVFPYSTCAHWYLVNWMLGSLKIGPHVVNTAQRLLISYHLEDTSVFKQTNSIQTGLFMVTKTCLPFFHFFL